MAYNASFDEKAAKINFLSTAIRLSDKQMPEIYNLLPPICEKLGIDVPELYYVKSKDMNAATIENQQLIKTPVVRNGKLATVGFRPDVWKNWN